MFKTLKMRIFVGLCFIIIGLGLIFYPQINREISAIEEKQLIAAFERLGEYDLNNLDKENDEAKSEQEESQPDENELLKDAEGIITIPTIDAQLMIFGNDEESSLSRGVGIMEQDKTIGINNVGLAGHRALAHGRLFNRLDEVEIDDRIFIKTRTDNYEFTVIDKFIVDQSQIEILEDKAEPYLTLVTCTPIGAKLPTDRLIVQAKLTNR